MGFHVNELFFSTKIQDGGLNSENSKFFRGFEQPVVTLWRVQNMLEIALLLPNVYRYNWHFHQNENTKKALVWVIKAIYSTVTL